MSARFWDLVGKETRTGCWPWLGERRGNNQYGSFTAGPGNRNRSLAHRKMHELTRGPIPPGMCVMHRCDNPICVNPEHLQLGTHADNMADMKRKGRARGHRGEAHPMAKLTEAQVIEIRRRYIPRVVGTPQLAKEFGVDTAMVQRIVTRKAWRHLP
jgi:hypothetical protein